MIKKIYNKLLRKILLKTYNEGYNAAIKDAQYICFDIEAYYAPTHDDANDVNLYRAQGAAECVNELDFLLKDKERKFV